MKHLSMTTGTILVRKKTILAMLIVSPGFCLGCLALLFAAFSGERPVPGADVQFVFRDVANDAGLREPLKGAMAHAAAWGDVIRGP